MDNFDKQMRNNNRVFNVIFVVALLGILGTWVVYGFIAYKTATCIGSDQCLQSSAKQIGTIIKTVRDASN